MLPAKVRDSVATSWAYSGVQSPRVPSTANQRKFPGSRSKPNKTLMASVAGDDCGDENLRRTAAVDEPHHVEVCEECGKSTCLDPHCLVCADFKLIHMSCRFSPEDAYKVDLGGILWGTKNNGSNSNLSAKLRRKLWDGIVFVFAIMALSKMWWFHLQQQQQQELLQEL